MDPGTLINGIKLELNDLSKFVFTLNPLGWCVGNIFIKSSWQHNLYSLPEATDGGTGHHHHGQRRRLISGLHFTSFRAIRSLYWEWEPIGLHTAAAPASWSHSYLSGTGYDLGMSEFITCSGCHHKLFYSYVTSHDMPRSWPAPHK